VNILCVGGGPGGLFFAISALRSDPRHRVTVVERRPAATTYGWGIAVAAAASYSDDLLHGIHAVDPETAAAVRAACTEWSGQHVSVGAARPVHLGGSGRTMGRQQLIDLLTQRARELGADVHFSREVLDPAVADGHDLVVLADGAGSRVRRSRADRFGTTETVGRNKHVWLRTTCPLADFTYAFEPTPAGWIWFYGYRYEPGASTVIVECSADTWAGLGFDRADDDAVTGRLAGIFAHHLDGHPLQSRADGSGRSPWESFTTVRNERWSDGTVVLLGDSAHTAHFSIGSGTTMAIEDGAVLGRALAGCSPTDLPPALRRYEELRRPAVQALQEAAERSAGWFEDVDRHLRRDPVDVGFSLRMRRNGTVDGRRPLLLYGLHRVTQWPAGRTARRVLADRRRSLQQRRAEPSRPTSDIGERI
jgi:anthraniloyl-CoA monooxygenase